MKSFQDIQSLFEKMIAGDARALSRLMTVVESAPENIPEVMSRVYKLGRTARRIGISGPPGAGKSTLLANIVAREAAAGLKVGVLCIDPTSPISGGAILGDRVRINETFPPEQVFIRSVASGDSLGGLARATKLHTLLLEAAGFDIVLIETVGLGQVGYDITSIAETLALVLVPESGDTVQVLKSGIIELADIVIVNKSDRAGADEIAESLKNIFFEERNGWRIPVISAIARDGAGTDEIMLQFAAHYEYKKENGGLLTIRDRRADFAQAFLSGAGRLLADAQASAETLLDPYIDSVENNGTDPYTAAARAVDELLLKGKKQ